MKRTVTIGLIALLFIAMSAATFGEPPILTCYAQDIGIRLPAARYEVGDGPSASFLGFWFDSHGNMYTSEWSNDAGSNFRKYLPDFSSSTIIKKETSGYDIYQIGLDCMLCADGSSFAVWRQKPDRMYFARGITLNGGRNPNDQEWYMYAIRDTVIYKRKRVDGKGGYAITYVGYIFNDSDTYMRLEGDEFVRYAKIKLPEVQVVGDKLKVNGYALSGISAILDDDGNEYDFAAMRRDGEPYADIISKYDRREQYDQSLVRKTFDHEGNCWYLLFKSEDDQQPQLLYAGRDWGYRQPPRKAVCTSDNLRIRLRATTAGYVMGKLMSGQAITILKTGGNATIDGMTAPWYRIKTANGLIGWAWGGYIKLL